MPSAIVPARLAPALLLLFACACGFAADRGHRAQYVGGTVSTPTNAEGKFFLTGEDVLIFRARESEIRVPYDRINMIEYGQKVDRRYAMAVVVSPLLLLSKKRQHFLTIGYTDEDGKQQAAVFKVDKSGIRPVLVSLEAKTGKKVEYQDPEARKAGRG